MISQHPTIRIIELTELSKGREEEIKESPVLINVEGITTIQTMDWKDDAPHIIGETKTKTITAVNLVNGRAVHVKETLAEIHEKITRLLE